MGLEIKSFSERSVFYGLSSSFLMHTDYEIQDPKPSIQETFEEFKRENNEQLLPRVLHEEILHDVKFILKTNG